MKSSNLAVEVVCHGQLSIHVCMYACIACMHVLHVCMYVCIVVGIVCMVNELYMYACMHVLNACVYV
jgi:hypothetical protein